MTICAVVGCKSSNDKRRIKYPDNVVEVSFCRFPRDEELRKVWLYRCGREQNCKAKRLFVCIQHFKQADFVRNLRHELLQYHPKSSRKVKVDAVPCLFLPSSVVVPESELIDKPIVPIPTATIPSYNKSNSNVQKKETVIQERQTLIVKPISDIPKPISDIPKPKKAQAFIQNRQTLIVKPISDNPKPKKPQAFLQKHKLFIVKPISDILNAIEGIPKPILDIPKAFLLTNQNINSAEKILSEFIDHVVMVYLNRCRSRAANPNVGMPEYILKRKAQEASFLLGGSYFIDCHWIGNFKRKLAEQDAKGIVLTPHHESLSIADIISEDWPKFAKKKGLDIGEDSEDTISVDENETMQTETVTLHNKEELSSGRNSHDVQTQSKDRLSDCPRFESPVANETTESDTLQKQNFVESNPHEDFLRHVLMVFIARFKATWPQAYVPEIILNAKFREAALILRSKINDRKIWLADFKKSLKTKPDPPIITEPNQSVDMNDIITEERTQFNFQNKTNTTLVKESESDETDQKNVEYSDSIETYEEARDCLNLLNNYALELGDLTALALIWKVDSYLKSDDCQ